MKKIVVFLILALFLVAGQNEVKAQCENCVTPYQCTSFQLNIGGDCGLVTYYACYYCDPTQNITRIDLIELSNWDLACADAIWDAGIEYILDNAESFCGNHPCSEGIRRIEVTTFTCGDYFWRRRV